MRDNSLSIQREAFHDHYIPEPTTGCWLWLRKVDRDGYGRIWTGSKEIGAHRWSYANLVGEVLPETRVLHRCDTPSCVNPYHLFLGSQSDNMNDAAAKGRLRSRQKLPPELLNAIIKSTLARNATAKTLGVSSRTVQLIWQKFKAERAEAIKCSSSENPPTRALGTPSATRSAIQVAN